MATLSKKQLEGRALLRRLKKLSEEYLNTLEDAYKDEWYTTERGIHEEGVEGFLNFVQKKVNSKK